MSEAESKKKSYSNDFKEGLRVKYNQQGRGSVKAFADANGIGYQTFRTYLEKMEGASNQAGAGATGKDSHLSDFRNRTIEDEHEQYHQWLKDERSRLIARVKELEAKIAKSQE